METKNLTNLHEGDTAYVSLIKTPGRLGHRLLDLGLVEGTKVCCSYKSPYGDPVAYKIRGALIALRNEDARNVIVSCINSN